MVKEIKNNAFDPVTTAEIAVVDFNATWCGPCRMLAPILEELSDEMDKVAFFACDVDENEELARTYGIRNIPAVGLFKNGKLIDMSIGFKPKTAMQQFISAHMQ